MDLIIKSNSAFTMLKKCYKNLEKENAMSDPTSAEITEVRN